MEEELKRKNSNNMNGSEEEIIPNNNNNNNFNSNHDTKKLVLTIKVNDETEPVNNNTSSSSENEKIIHVNGSTAIHIMAPSSAQLSQNNGSSAISSIPINIPNNESEYLNVEEEEDDGEVFDFSSSDFEDAQEEVSVASDIRSEESLQGMNLNLTVDESSDISILQSPGPLETSSSMDLTPVDVAEEAPEANLAGNRSKSIDAGEKRTEDDVLISQFFGKANEIVGSFKILSYECLLAEISARKGGGIIDKISRVSSFVSQNCDVQQKMS